MSTEGGLEGERRPRIKGEDGGRGGAGGCEEEVKGGGGRHGGEGGATIPSPPVRPKLPSSLHGLNSLPAQALILCLNVSCLLPLGASNTFQVCLNECSFPPIVHSTPPIKQIFLPPAPRGFQHLLGVSDIVFPPDISPVRPCQRLKYPFFLPPAPAGFHYLQGV